MSEIPESIDSVAIGDKRFSRLMAKELASDIELANSIRPGIWAIHSDVGLLIGDAVFLKCDLARSPVYLVDSEGAEGELIHVIEQFGRKPHVRTRPTWQYLDLPESDRGNLLRIARPAHERAIREYVPNFNKCKKWHWHDLPAVGTLNNILGRELPEPSYLEELQEFRISRPTTSDYSPVADIDADMLEILAKDLELAHSENPRSWSLFRTEAGGVVLMVESAAATYVAHDRGQIAVEGKPGDLNFAQLPLSTKKREYRTFNGFTLISSTPHEFLENALEFREPHEAAVRILAGTVKTRTLRANEHQPATLESLSMAVGRELPSPAYLDDSPLEITAKESVQFNTVLAMQMASDIELVHSVSPGAWVVGRNSALTVGDLTALSFLEPVKHRFLVESDEAAGDALALIDKADESPHSTMNPTFRALQLPRTGIEEFVEILKPLHEQALVKHASRWKRSQRWNDHDFETLDLLSRIVGRPLPSPEYAAELRSRSMSESISPQSSVFDPKSALAHVRRQYAASGLHYTDQQLATFFTALQTKGFVILAGISGTGKSKIATGFVDMLPGPTVSAVLETDSSGRRPIIVQRYTKELRHLIVPVRFQDVFPPMIHGSSYQVQININGRDGTGSLALRLQNGRDLYRIYFHQNLSEAISQWVEGQSVYLNVFLNADGNRVERIQFSDEPPSIVSLETSFAEAEPNATNYLFLSVRPDWRDSSSLIGYYNPLLQTYEWTAFLRFLIKAQESFRAKDGLAWFVILDEMNLAHVEYYFADLLSVLESGRDADGWTREAIHISFPAGLDDEAPPQELKLPPNLYIIGTVNMDETTHAFSPKVLDRAFTIELSSVDFSSYEIDGSGVGSGLTEADKWQLLDIFTRFDNTSGIRRFARVEKSDVSEIVSIHPEVRDHLDSLNKVLMNYRFHFGYRVFDEIAQYLYNNERNGMSSFPAAFDHAVLMKVLPKFSGSRARLQGPLTALLAWTLWPDAPMLHVKEVQGMVQSLDPDNFAARGDLVAQAAFPAVAGRVLHMLIQLESDGFVAFG